MLEEKLSTSEKEMLSLRKECSQLEGVSAPTEDQKQTLHERKMALNELEVCVYMYMHACWCMYDSVYKSVCYSLASNAIPCV